MAVRLSSECRSLIACQRGVVARWQLASCPADLAGIDALLRRSRWRGMYRGVYAAFTGPPPRDAVLWAAVRRCGPGAVLSHVTAAELDGIADRRASAIHVTVPARRRVKLSERDVASGLPRIVVHRSSRLEWARHPARTPPRTRVEETVLDLAESARSFDLAFFWLSAACSGRMVTVDQVRQAVGLRKKLRWRAEILGALQEIADGVLSNLERQYHRCVQRPHGLPSRSARPGCVAMAHRPTLDNLYADFGVAVELDGRAAHPVQDRWLDIWRDNYFAGTGIVTVRYSWADVTERPCQVAAQIALVLQQRGWNGAVRRCGASCQAGRS